MSETPFLTIEQAAERAQVSRGTIKKWMREGMPAIHLSPRMVRIHVEHFDHWVVGRNTGTTDVQAWAERNIAPKAFLVDSTGYRR